MARQTKVILFGVKTAATDGLILGLRAEALDVAAISRPADAAQTASPDLVLIDASAGDAATAVRDCRTYWPDQTTPVLVVGSPDAATSAAAIDAGATDSVGDALSGPLMSAHVRRILRAGEALRSMLDDERQRAKRESMALAAADMAVPLGELLDELEAVMARAPVDERLDELLELTGRAVDAVDRLRRLATSADSPVAERDGG
jgi:DNA-binding NarL/FixJ family response regulator